MSSLTPAQVAALGRGWGRPTRSQILSFAPFPFCKFEDLLIHLQGVNFPKALSALPGCLWHYPCRHDRLAFLLYPAGWSPPAFVSRSRKLSGVLVLAKPGFTLLPEPGCAVAGASEPLD